MSGECCDSRLVGSSGLSLGSMRLTEVDQPLFLPCGVNCLLEVTSVDVIHCYSVPGLGVKVDAIPGRASLVPVTGLVSGYYTGYCAELCGSGHGFMPCGVVVYSSPSANHYGFIWLSRVVISSGYLVIPWSKPSGEARVVIWLSRAKSRQKQV